jgi:hypothetical protein
VQVGRSEVDVVGDKDREVAVPVDIKRRVQRRVEGRDGEVREDGEGLAEASYPADR